VTGPVAVWGDRFESTSDVAWLAVPGQLALAAQPREHVVEHLLGGGLERPFGVDTADVDGDGDVDVVGGAGESGLVAVWLSDGGQPPSFTRQVVDDGFPGASAVIAADIDGDGHTDVAAAAEMPGNRLAWWRNSGDHPITWTRHEIDLFLPVACSIDVADVDDDGHADVLSVSWVQGAVVWWENSGGDPVEWSRHTVGGQLAGAHSVQAVDLDHDGRVDVVAAGGQGHEIAWWRNQGGEPLTWSRQTICGDCVGARFAAVADLDGDGLEDVVGGAFDARLSWWRNQGGDPIVWSEHPIDARLFGLHHVDVTDLEGDGDLDVVATGGDEREVMWFANQNGDALTWAMHTIRADFTRAATAVAADLDGDGALEVVGSSIDLGRFAWWEVVESVPHGELVSSILDLGSEPTGLRLDWEATAPDGTVLSFAVSAADQPDQVGYSFETAVELTPLEVVGRYVQYRSTLETSDADASPVVHEVRLVVEAEGESRPPRVPSGRIGP
jgi:hypothetical protein